MFVIRDKCVFCRSDDTMYMDVTKVVMLDMYNHLNPKDQPYFRESREAMFKPMKLEEVTHGTFCCMLSMQIDSV